MEKIEIRDDAGNWVAEAERASRREPWTIRHEEGEERLHASEKKVRAHIAQRLKAPEADSSR
jgi:hypothetical protein